uniref:Menorin C-terminal domain-containing protein n=1 Tax=Plectus sambesii TaxID=2011161 RepID=A0A914UHR9_9BILA
RLVEDEGSFKRERWRAVQFINPTSVLSTIVESNESGPAFLGWPTAFLLSEHVPTRSSMSAPQTVSGRVLFVAKPGFVDTNPIGETGLSIFLLDNVADLPSPIIKGGIRVFIGHDGKVFIENRDAYTSQLRFLPKAISQMAVHDCYGFSVTDYNYEVQLSVWTDRCAGQAGDHAQPTPSWRRTLNLETPMTQRHRYVIVQKSGDAAVDCLVQDLDHNAATSPLLCSSVVSLLLMLPLLNFFQSV